MMGVHGLFGHQKFAWSSLLVTLLCLLPTLPVLAADTLGNGDGHLGSLYVSEAQRVVNDYTRLSFDANSGATSLSLDETLGAKAGDVLMLWQMQSGQDIASGLQSPIEFEALNVGHFELLEIESIVGHELELTAPLVSNYSKMLSQVIWVPQYSDVTIQSGASLVPQGWDGETGGVLALLVTGAVVVEGSLDASGAGFRGGQVLNHPEWHPNNTPPQGVGCESLDHNLQSGIEFGAEKGEGFLRGFYGPENTSRGNKGNGAGGGICTNSGGGGGGNWGTGGKGGGSESVFDGGRDVGGLGGGMALGNPEFRLSLGGGGGAGEGNNDDMTPGGKGGGVVFVRASTMSGAGSILAQGESSDHSMIDYDDAEHEDFDYSYNGGDIHFIDGAGGAGAGGTIHISATTVENLQVSARGGDGGDALRYASWGKYGPGGGGGGGAIFLDAERSNLVLDVDGGQSGISEFGDGSCVEVAPGALRCILDISTDPCTVGGLSYCLGGTARCTDIEGETMCVGTKIGASICSVLGDACTMNDHHFSTPGGPGLLFPAICGNGTVETGETCDDGNIENDDNCRNSCELNVCGDGFLDTEGEELEACDDGNLEDGDGCSSMCVIESLDEPGAEEEEPEEEMAEEKPGEPQSPSSETPKSVDEAEDDRGEQENQGTDQSQVLGCANVQGRAWFLPLLVIFIFWRRNLRARDRSKSFSI